MRINNIALVKKPRLEQKKKQKKTSNLEYGADNVENSIFILWTAIWNFKQTAISIPSLQTKINEMVQ